MHCLICDTEISAPKRLCDNCLAAEIALRGIPEAESQSQVGESRDWKIPDAAVGLTIDHDDFDDAYKLTCSEIPLEFTVANGPKCTVQSQFLGFKNSAGTSFVSLMVVRIGKDWQWLSNHDGRALVDGLAESCVTAVKSSVMDSGDTLEIVSIMLAMESAQKWANAEQVRFRLGIWDTVMHPQLQAQLRALVNKMDTLV